MRHHPARAESLDWKKEKTSPHELNSERDRVRRGPSGKCMLGLQKVSDDSDLTRMGWCQGFLNLLVVSSLGRLGQ